MAGGRADLNLPIGYVFIFFYGLERRVLIENADEEVALEEVRRLLKLHADNSGSFRGYASEFLAFAPLRKVDRFLQMPEAVVAEKLGRLVGTSATALAAVTGWYHVHARPLPAQYAALVAQGLENAKRGSVVSRSAVELNDLFSIRYRDKFGEGMVLEAKKRPLSVDYRPASGTLSRLQRTLQVSLPDVLGKVGQLRALVTVWNDCVDALRKASSQKRGGKPLDGAGWAALPSELRAEYDHPDQDAWDLSIAETPVLGGFHLVTIGHLAGLTGLEPAEKATPAQVRKIGTRAADVGYATEPELRLRSKAMEWPSEILIWREANLALPDAKVYGGAFAMLSLAMRVAMADGVLERSEEDVVNAFMAELFTFDAEMRTRVEAMKRLMARNSGGLGTVAKTLKATRTTAELTKVGAVLVAIAAADGVIAEAEEEALKSLYRSLGLPPADLAKTISKTGARLERDRTVEVQAARVGASGVPIPRQPDAPAGFQLDQAAIDAIVADTKEVAAILAAVFSEGPDAMSEEVDADSSARPPQVAMASELPRASEATTKLAQGLDIRYHAVLEELLAKTVWSPADIRRIAERHRLMPNAILDSVNAWSDEAFGDFLIGEDSGWKINRELLGGT